MPAVDRRRTNENKQKQKQSKKGAERNKSVMEHERARELDISHSLMFFALQTSIAINRQESICLIGLFIIK